ncbi:unnamed protein product [Symbiodinium microadriaticum]|nr:unnamed protein product [Symbiodinium microadriaticum]CAE7949104.1 unnamed protein product [Symbiodinium sp. KB8]
MATLAQAWESSAVIRGRFRKQISWIQFPIPVQKETRDTDSQKQQKTKKDKTDKADPHLPTTRALELNVEILEKMLDHCSNEFLEVGKLQKVEELFRQVSFEPAPNQDPDVKTLFDRISELRAQLLLQEDEVADATRSDDEFYEPDSEIAGPAAMEDHGSGEDAELGDATEDHHASEDVEFCDAMEDNDAGEDAELCDAPEDRDCGEDAGADGRDVVMDRHRSRLSTTSFEAPSEAGRIGEMVTEEMMGELPEGMDDEQAMELSVILQQIHDLELGFVSENVIVYAESALSQCEGESIAPTETPSASVHPVVPPLPRVAAETKPMPNPDQEETQIQVEPEVTLVTPAMQAELRADKAKQAMLEKVPDMKEPEEGADRGDEGLDEPEAASPKAAPKGKAKAKAKAKAATAEPKGKPKAKACAKADEDEDHAATNVRSKAKAGTQRRVWLTPTRWIFEILDGQELGCNSCRYLYGGCATCRKPGFKGQKAEYFWYCNQYQTAVAKLDDDEGEIPPSKKVQATRLLVIQHHRAHAPITVDSSGWMTESKPGLQCMLFVFEHDLATTEVMMDKELFQDLWKDARMWEVIRYLEGGCALQVPPAQPFNRNSQSQWLAVGTARRDKYQRNIREFWVDTETTGSYEDEQGERFEEETGAEGMASSFILGGVGPDEPLPIATADDEDEDEDDDGAEEEEGRRTSKARGSELEQERALESVENIGTVMSNILKIQQKLEATIKKLKQLETEDAKKITKKLTICVQKAETTCSRGLMEDTKLKKCKPQQYHFGPSV